MTVVYGPSAGPALRLLDDPFTVTYLPVPHGESDEPDKTLNRQMGRIEHRRHGLLVGARNFSSVGVWNFDIRGMEVELIESLRAYWSAIHFEFLPAGEDGVGQEITVYWDSNQFKPRRRRDGLYDLLIPLKEIP